MKKITKLTPAQKAAMKPWAEKWIKIGLSCEPADREKAEAAYRACYRFAGLNPDVPIVWVRSPIVGAFATSISAKILNSGAVRGAVGGAVGDAVYGAVGGAVRGAVGGAVRGAVYDEVSGAVDGAVGDAVDGAVYGAVRGEVNDAVYDEVSGAVGWHSWCGGALWSYWPAYESFFREVCGLTLDGDMAARAEAWAACSENAGYWWPNKDFIIACDRPAFINRDGQGQLHSESGMAIQWRDGWGLHMWHGTRVPGHWIEQKDTVDPAEIIAAENVEQRAAGAAILGWPRMLKILKAKVIDDSGNADIGQLIELTLPGLPEPGRFLKARCPRNGIICEGVPRVSDIDGLPINTALAAQAWRIGDPLSEYIHPENRT